jgi:hypothetical protein
MEENRMKLWSQLRLALLLFLLIIFLGGCGSGRTMVLKPTEIKQHFSSVEIIEGNSTVNVPADVKKVFSQKLEKFVYEEGGFQKGNELKLKYRFIQFNPGSQFTRYMWGGLGSSGKGTLTVEAKFFDPTDQELAMIQSEGEISSGVFGGSFDFALEKCAKEIAEYTKHNFK